MTTSCEGILAHVEAALQRSRIEPVPWQHAYLEDALPTAVAREIESALSGVELRSVSSPVDAGKTYRMSTERPDDAAVAAYPSPVAALIESLRSCRYRTALETFTGVNLAHSHLTVDVWRYREGDWLDPHVDKPAKMVTQLFYFTPGWTPQAGGHLLIMERRSDSEPYRRLPPRTGSSSVLVRSDQSWHAVQRSVGPGIPRTTVAATFWSTSPARAFATGRAY